jgi:hypothetical protein
MATYDIKGVRTGRIWHDTLRLKRGIKWFYRLPFVGENLRQYHLRQDAVSQSLEFNERYREIGKWLGRMKERDQSIMYVMQRDACADKEGTNFRHADQRDRNRECPSFPRQPELLCDCRTPFPWSEEDDCYYCPKCDAIHHPDPS